MAAWSQFKVFIVRHRRPRLGRDCKSAACVSARSGQHRHLARRLQPSRTLLATDAAAKRVCAVTTNRPVPLREDAAADPGGPPRPVAPRPRHRRTVTASESAAPDNSPATPPPQEHDGDTDRRIFHGGDATVAPQKPPAGRASSPVITSGNGAGASGFGRSGARGSAAAILTDLLALSHARKHTQK